jgi:hypothetical protein
MNVIGVNAKLGDGSLHMPTKESTNARIHFNSKNLEWLTYKRDLAIKEGFNVSLIKDAYSGYSDKMNLYKFTVNTDERLTYVYKHSRYEVIESLTKTDLIMWYLDDGSWHKVRHTMHLYCNMLTEDEVEVLINRIEWLYGIRPKNRVDRKKDGRAYPYLYFPRKLVEAFKPDVREFLETNRIDSMLYKVGETSTTS